MKHRILHKISNLGGCDNNCSACESTNIQRGLVWRRPREFSLKEMETEMEGDVLRVLGENRERGSQIQKKAGRRESSEKRKRWKKS